MSVREAAELLVLDPTGDSRARNPKGAREVAQTAAFLNGESQAVRRKG